LKEEEGLVRDSEEYLLYEGGLFNGEERVPRSGRRALE
jgi:hypothetical protein